MPIFSYKGTKNDQLVKGKIEARDEEDAFANLKKSNIEILSIKGSESDKSSSLDSKSKKILGKVGKIKKGDKVFIYKNFSTMLKAGLPLLESIDLIKDSIKDKKVVKILTQLRYDIEAGSFISDSLAKNKGVFSENEISMLKAGEAGGKLPDSFFNLFQDTDAETRLQKDIKSAMIYPILILSILLLVSLLLVLFVLPQMTGFFEQSDIAIPTMTKLTMGFSNFMRKNFLLIGIVLTAIITAIKVSVKKSSKAKKINDKVMLRIPFLGKQMKYFYIYKISRMLGLLIKSGVPIVQAVEIVEKSVTNTLYKNSITMMKEDLKKGQKLSESIEKFPEIYPSFVSRMVKVGEKTGNTSEALQNISDLYRDNLQETLKNLPSLIEPVLLLFLGAGVAFIAISVLVPMYSIVSGINQMQK